MVLPDLLETGLKVVFCGTAVGERSARRKAYYAGPGNQFWDILAKTGLTPYRLHPEQYPALVQYGIGLTDLVKKRFGGDAALSSRDFDVEGFMAKVKRSSPIAIGFNGKKAAEVFFGRKVNYGRQKERIGDTAIFVLPSTSGAARGFWDAKHWHELAEFVGGARGSSPVAQDGGGVEGERRGRTITRKRVLRPSTRMPDSPYRVKTEDVGSDDMLLLTVSHESAPEKPIGVYKFRGSDIDGKRSIYFKAEQSGVGWKVRFVGVNPFSTVLAPG